MYLCTYLYTNLSTIIIIMIIVMIIIMIIIIIYLSIYLSVYLSIYLSKSWDSFLLDARLMSVNRAVHGQTAVIHKPYTRKQTICGMFLPIPTTI